jgi:hypothetical protein
MVMVKAPADAMASSTLMSLANFSAIIGVVLLATAVLCLVFNRILKALEVLAADVCALVVLEHTYRQSEHRELGQGNASLIKLLTSQPSPDALMKGPLYLKNLRDGKIHMVDWAWKVGTGAVGAFTLAGMIYGYVALI